MMLYFCMATFKPKIPIERILDIVKMLPFGCGRMMKLKQKSDSSVFIQYLYRLNVNDAFKDIHSFK